MSEFKKELAYLLKKHKASLVCESKNNPSDYSVELGVQRSDLRNEWLGRHHITPFDLCREEQGSCNSGWVSVGEQMPEHGVDVLGFCNDINIGWQQVIKRYKCPEYETEEWLDVNGDNFPCIVTHWMPLPKPPSP